MSFHVDSEVGRLRQVIMHRPGLELTRLTPSNVDELLFDDVMWAAAGPGGARRVRREAARQGREGHLFRDLLAQALDQPGAREFVQDELTTATRFGPALDKPLDELVGQTPADRWPRLLIGGVLKRDLDLPTTLQPAAGVPGRGRLPAAPAAEPPVPAGQLRLGLRRAVDQPDGQAGPQAGDDQFPAGLQLPPDVPRRRPAALLLRQRQRRPTTRPTARAATSWSSATAR